MSELPEWLQEKQWGEQEGNGVSYQIRKTIEGTWILRQTNEKNKEIIVIELAPEGMVEDGMAKSRVRPPSQRDRVSNTLYKTPDATRFGYVKLASVDCRTGDTLDLSLATLVDFLEILRAKGN